MAEYFEEIAQEAVRLAARAGLPAVEVAEVGDWVLTGRRPELAHWRSQIGPADAGLALRMVGRRDEVHPRDAYAMRYPNDESADLGAYLNTAWYGHEILGRAALDDGVVIVLDLRPAMRRLTPASDELREPTDPTLPDDWKPGG